MKDWKPEVQYWPTTKPIAYARNTKKHPDSQVNRIAGSIAANGFVQPILVDKEGIIIAGHGRLEAAKSLGMQEVPVIVADHLTEGETRALRLADNRLNESPWDTDMLRFELKGLEDLGIDLKFASFDLPEIKQFIENGKIIDGLFDSERYTETESKIEPVEGEDDVPDADQVPKVVKAGELWILGNHRLLCGDSTNREDVKRLMGGNNPDMIFTDPPYGVGLKYNDHNDSDLSAYYDLMNGWFSIAKSFGCLIAATVGHKNNNWWFKHHEPNSFLVWFDKTKQSPHSHAYLCKTELILLWGKIETRYSWDLLEINHERSKDASQNHPCPKPIKLVEEILRPESKKVLDFFAGSGTTLIACEKTRRKCFGMEIDPTYCAIILRRWAEFTGNDPVREDGVKFSDLIDDWNSKNNVA